MLKISFVIHVYISNVSADPKNVVNKKFVHFCIYNQIYSYFFQQINLQFL
jgi:hypothetical protein